MIYIIPENVMRWISGQGERYGEEQALGETKGAVERGTGGIKGAGEGAKGGGESFKQQHKGELGAAQEKKSKEEAPKLESTDKKGGGKTE